MELFWIFTSVTLLVMLLIVAMRQGQMSWAWNLLFVAVILFIGLFKVTGTPRDAWLFATIENLHGDMEVVSQVVIPHKFIYLLIRTTPGEQPYYVRLPWSQGIEEELDAAMMLAKERQTALLADVDKLSSWRMGEQAKPFKNGKGEGDSSGTRTEAKAQTQQGKEGAEAIFHPRPVQPDPLKIPTHTQIELH